MIKAPKIAFVRVKGLRQDRTSGRKKKDEDSEKAIGNGGSLQYTPRVEERGGLRKKQSNIKDI